MWPNTPRSFISIFLLCFSSFLCRLLCGLQRLWFFGDFRHLLPPVFIFWHFTPCKFCEFLYFPVPGCCYFSHASANFSGFDLAFSGLLLSANPVVSSSSFVSSNSGSNLFLHLKVTWPLKGVSPVSWTIPVATVCA